MANVKEQSLIDDGVPQSPFTDTGQHYTPYDSSLHDTTDKQISLLVR